MGTGVGEGGRVLMLMGGGGWDVVWVWGWDRLTDIVPNLHATVGCVQWGVM